MAVVIFRISEISLGSRQKFAQATNFMKKIYSVHEGPEEIMKEF